MPRGFRPDGTKLGFQKGHIPYGSAIHGFMKHTEEHKKIMSLTRTGESNPFFGKKHSNKTKKIMSIQRTGENSPVWKGGKFKNYGGYIMIYSPNHPYRNARNKVAQHRLVVESKIGRYLTTKETVHHIDFIKNNNVPTNLIAFISQGSHIRFHFNPNLIKPEEIIFDGRKLSLIPV